MAKLCSQEIINHSPIVFRAAKPQDITAVAALGIKALTEHAYSGLVIDETKVKDMAVACISSPSHFCYVAEKNLQVVAAVSAFVMPMVFHQRQQANVVQFYSTVAGAGAPLLRRLMWWWRNRPGVRTLCFTLECGCDPRIIKLLTRLGLTREFPVMMACK